MAAVESCLFLLGTYFLGLTQCHGVTSEIDALLGIFYCGPASSGLDSPTPPHTFNNEKEEIRGSGGSLIIRAWEGELVVPSLT